MSEEEKYIINPITRQKILSTKFIVEDYYKKCEEIERLKNIINEFNKLIEYEIDKSKFEDDYDRADSLEYCLATLQELKGSDK